MQRILAIFSTCALALVVGVACGDTSVDSTTASLDYDGSGSGMGSGSGSGMGSGSGSGSGMGADCTPGFYKNHFELWDDELDNCGEKNGERKRNCGPYPELERACCEGMECDDLLIDLSAQEGSDEAMRSAAKAFLDACFADMEPCEDEDDPEYED